MEPQRETYNQRTIELIEEVIERERTVVESHRRQVSQTGDARLKSLLLKLTDSHVQSCNELSAFLTQIRSEDEITRQINDMFL